MKDEVTFLDKGCTILGYFDDIPDIEVGELFINHEALIMTYTDGLTDLQNSKGESFETEHVEDFIRMHYHLPVKDFNEKLMKHIEKFKGNQPYPDDIALLTCRIF